MILSSQLAAVLLLGFWASLGNSFLALDRPRPSSGAASSTRISKAFPPRKHTRIRATASETEQNVVAAPQVFASGYSQDMDLVKALQEATAMAFEALPPEPGTIDLATVTVSSLYDGNASPSLVVPTLVEVAKAKGSPIQTLIGCTNGGYIASQANLQDLPYVEEDGQPPYRACEPLEREGVPGVSVVLALLPDVQLETFHVVGTDVPEDVISPDVWKASVGLSSSSSEANAVMLLPSPAFQPALDDFLRGVTLSLPRATVFGGMASTVSSLSRARLFRYEADKDCISTLADGCVGVSMTGDIAVTTLVAQGAKPVGGIYQVVQGQDSTIQAIALDETATELLQQAEEEDDVDEGEEDEEDEPKDEKAKLQATYAKARIPKPALAEANFIMRNLSDDDQAAMKKAILIGLERGVSPGASPSELARLASGDGYRFQVHQVASAGMKDGSVTFSLGSVNIQKGMRLRFYVREGEFAKREVDALWMGYKRRALAESMKNDAVAFNPSACFLFPTLDRGSKFFLGKGGFESNKASMFLPMVPCISGFFSNGVIGKLDSSVTTKESVRVHGSASEYVLLGSKSGRPLFNAAQAAADRAKKEEQAVDASAEKDSIEKDSANRQSKVKTYGDIEEAAPRDANGELIIKRREIHSGRALTVSTVEWSVAEKSATPTSALEGFMWDKETEVDRFRERVPLANLLSQCKLANMDPTKPKPRDWIGPVKEAGKNGDFVIIPECKKTEPTGGSLWKRYDLAKLTKRFVTAGVPALSVNCDAVLFGGSIDDIMKVREATSKAILDAGSDDGVVVPPVLASDLLLYPYQIYKLRLAGADAMNLLVAALEAKDLVYLTKIASTLSMQVLVTVTSEAQVKMLEKLSPGSIAGVIVSNRNLEDFSFDTTGQQALDILASSSLAQFREKHIEVPVLAEGRIGIIERPGMDGKLSVEAYMQELQDAGAIGAIVGGGMVQTDSSSGTPLLLSTRELV